MFQRLAALLLVSASFLMPAHAQQQPQTDLPRTQLSVGLYKIDAQITAYNANMSGTTYNAPTMVPAATGFWSYRIAYRSERNTVSNARAEGDMAAYLLVPEHPLANAPLVVFGHGSVGVAPATACSLTGWLQPSTSSARPPASVQ